MKNNEKGAFWLGFVSCILLVILVAFFVSPWTEPSPSCLTATHYLTNDEIITETKHCEENGLKAVAKIVYTGFSDQYHTVAIECSPKE